jgi:hypothetical protein
MVGRGIGMAGKVCVMGGIEGFENVQAGIFTVGRAT